MIKIIRSDKRHFSDFGWLKTYWLFSFSSYYDPDNIQFGALRVFNDDLVDGLEPSLPSEESTIFENEKRRKSDEIDAFELVNWAIPKFQSVMDEGIAVYEYVYDNNNLLTEETKYIWWKGIEWLGEYKYIFTYAAENGMEGQV